MEILIGVILGIAMFIGSLAGFFSLFTKGDKEAKIKALEIELANIKDRLQV